MTNDNVQTMIERYRRELIEFNKRNPGKNNGNSQLNDSKSRAAEAAMEKKDEQNRYKTPAQPDNRQMNDRPMNERMMNERPMNERMMNERMMNERMMNERMMNERMMNERPMNDLMMNERPMNDRPMNDHMMNERPMNERPMNERPMYQRMMNDWQINRQPMNAMRGEQSDYDTVSEFENSRLYAELNAADSDSTNNNMDRIRPYRGLTRLGRDAITVMADADMNDSPISMEILAANPEAAAENAIFERTSERFPPYSEGVGKTYANLDEFLAENTKSGTLRVQAAAAEQSFPISNAEVLVTKEFTNGTHEFFRLFTDVSGIVADMTLPAPDRAFTAYPTALAPYATYDIAVSHPRFVTVILKNCAIFDGVESIQYCEMVPKVASTKQSIVFEEIPTK